jgi:hypothetical protein
MLHFIVDPAACAPDAANAAAGASANANHNAFLAMTCSFSR